MGDLSETENAVMRIVGHPKYPGAPGLPPVVAAILVRLRALPGHVFWPDDISLVESSHVNVDHLLTPGQVTDSYLLALAVQHHAQLATFDRRLSTRALREGKAALHLIAGT